jgi:hypothetical protein
MHDDLPQGGGGKLISMYSAAAESPGVLIIFNMPDPEMAMSYGRGHGGRRNTTLSSRVL